MGWNDRLPEDPYTPPPEYYHARDEYEAWLEYVEMRLLEEEQTGLTSQNIDPASLIAKNHDQSTAQTQSQEKENSFEEEKEQRLHVQRGHNDHEETTAEFPF